MTTTITELCEKIDTLNINITINNFANSEMVKCRQCKKPQAQNEYLSTSKLGYCKTCLTCRNKRNKYNKKKYDKNKEDVFKDDEKKCSQCGEYKKQDQYISKLNNTETVKCLACRNLTSIYNKCCHNITKNVCPQCAPTNRIVAEYRTKIANMFIDYSQEYFNPALGCTKKEFIEHITKQFDDQMSWDNYTKYWQLDHYLPLLEIRDGDYLPLDEIKERMKYTNIQPLKISENQSKANKNPLLDVE